MKYKQWIKKWFLILSLIVLLPLTNYIIDPYQIMQSKVLPYEYQISERYLKIEFLKKNHSKFDSYMFGSSRIGTTKPEIIEKYLSGSKFYNFTVSSADLYDHIKHLEYFIQKDWTVKNIYLQIDINNMASYEDTRPSYGQKLHPEVIGDTLIYYYTKYLFSVYPSSIIGKIKKNFEKRNQLEYSISKGFWEKPEKEMEIKGNCNNYIKQEKSFNMNYTRNEKSTLINKPIDSIKKFKDLCTKYGINLILFTTPHNHNMMDTFNLDNYYNFLRKIAEISDFYNFSGYNSITNNDCNYYEWSHYRPIISEIVAARIFGDKKITVPNDFGIYITKFNVENYIRILKEKGSE